MNTHQLRNVLALSRHGLIAAGQDRSVSEEAFAELAADAAAVKAHLLRLEAEEKSAQAAAEEAAQAAIRAAKAGQ